MLEVRDLPSIETLMEFGKEYNNPDVDALHTWLLWTARTTDVLSEFDTFLLEHDLMQSKFFVLILLKRNPEGLSVGALASGVGVASPTMTRIIDRMEAAGLCEKHADETDRRAWVVRLADGGDRILTRVMPQYYAWVANFMLDFSAADRKDLRRLMRKAVASLGKMREKAAS